MSGIERRDLLEPLLAAERDVRREALVLEEDAERLENPGLVVDDEHGRAGGWRDHASISAGMRC